MILGLGIDFWVYLCWVCVLLLGFCFLSEFSENVLSVCCLFYWPVWLIAGVEGYRKVRPGEIATLKISSRGTKRVEKVYRQPTWSSGRRGFWLSSGCLSELVDGIQ